jgi:hypothetical protein
VGLPAGGIAGEAPAERRDRGVVASLAQEHLAQVQPWQVPGRRERRRTLERAARFLEVAGVVQRSAVCVLHRGVPWREPHALLEGAPRAFRVAARLEDVPEVQLRRGRARPRRDGAQRPLGPEQVAARLQRQAQVRGERGVVRFEAQPGRRLRHGTAGPPQCRVDRREVAAQPRVPRRLAQRGFVREGRRGVLAARVQGQGTREVLPGRDG